jgi:hypothetical protein
VVTTGSVPQDFCSNRKLVILSFIVKRKCAFNNTIKRLAELKMSLKDGCGDRQSFFKNAANTTQISIPKAKIVVE